MNKTDKILITGASGLVGHALSTHLKREGYKDVTGVGSADCDLTDRAATLAYFAKQKPDYVFHLAGHVFGIMGNMLNQGDGYLLNLLINTHVIEACRLIGVKKITAMGTGAMYPYPMPSNPLREDTIWMGEPHGSERGYAHAKRSMLAQLDVYRESYKMPYALVVSCNLYGPHDRFNIETGHVVPSLVRKFYEASQSGQNISVWGDGSAQRDFLYVDDVARALELIMQNADGPINLGSHAIHSIREAVDILAAHTKQQDKIVWDASKPNGQPFRAYDLSKLDRLGYRAAYTLERGLKETYDWYANNHQAARR